MRQPQAERELIEGDRLKRMRIDVRDGASIRAAVAEAVALFGTIDVWVNNAGYGAFGPVEAGSRAQIQRQFDKGCGMK